MGLHNQGTVHLFGAEGTASNGTITDESFDDVCANIASVVDEVGNEINRRYDDLTTTGTVTLIQRSAFTIPTVGATFSHNSITYEVTGIGRKRTSRGFRICEVRIKKSEYITPS